MTALVAFCVNTNPVVISWSHTTTTAANRYIVVGVSINLAGGTVPTNVNVTGVTYGGTAMTFLGGNINSILSDTGNKI